MFVNCFMRALFVVRCVNKMVLGFSAGSIRLCNLQDLCNVPCRTLLYFTSMAAVEI